MQLEGLPSRQFQGVVAITAGQLVHFQPLRRCCDSGRHPHPQHETVKRFEFLLGAFGAQIAIILLIAAVEFDDHGVIGTDGAGVAIGKALFQAATQEIAARLDAFHFAWSTHLVVLVIGS